ncbi:MAG: hypothetical protein IPH72_34700 [Sandaracinaceae bacterium]|nr:hypothetical protein [Sandaracinaceae bacterium]
MTDEPTTRVRRLRVVAVNDVYVLDELPRLASLVQAARTRDPADCLLVTVAGDFLAPSLLSSLDEGRGMVDCLNALGVTHVTLGNHEDDLEPGSARPPRGAERRGAAHERGGLSGTPRGVGHRGRGRCARGAGGCGQR